ncbi:hypothetical protein [Vibrio phage BX-1]|nr:hypothetical protein [Vibrio phage BX-1]
MPTSSFFDSKKFWDEKIQKVNDGVLLCRESDYMVMSINPLNLVEKYLGMGGSVHIIPWEGKLLLSNNVWCAGNIPEDRRGEVTANLCNSINNHGLFNVGLLTRYKAASHGDSTIKKDDLMQLCQEHRNFLVNQEESHFAFMQDMNDKMIKNLDNTIELLKTLDVE